MSKQIAKNLQILDSRAIIKRCVLAEGEACGSTNWCH